MKKFLALVMAMMMVLAMGTAFAEGTPVDQTQGNKVLKKEYTVAENVAGVNSPAETFTFDVTPVGYYTNTEDTTAEDISADLIPSVQNAVYAAGEAGTADKATKELAITLPEYTQVGIYKYTITENAGTTLGVIYSEREIGLTVTVLQGTDGKIGVVAVHCENEDGQKTNTFSDNKYQAGTLTVTKNVTGNMGDETKDFEMTVTFTAPAGKSVAAQTPIVFKEGTTTDELTFVDDGVNGVITKTFNLKHGESITFENIPYGVTYTVVEDSYAADGYTTTYQVGTANATASSVDKAFAGSETVTVNNDNNNGDIDTGIMLDNAPYMMIMAMVVLAGAAMMMKRRAY